MLYGQPRATCYLIILTPSINPIYEVENGSNTVFRSFDQNLKSQLGKVSFQQKLVSDICIEKNKHHEASTSGLIDRDSSYSNWSPRVTFFSEKDKLKRSLLVSLKTSVLSKRKSAMKIWKKINYEHCRNASPNAQR